MPVDQEPPGDARPAGDPPSLLQVFAYSAPARIVVVSLQLLAALNVLYLAASILYDIVEGAQTAPPEIVALGLAVLSGIPWVAVALIRRLLSATLEIRPTLLVLTLRRARFEIPLASVAAIRPWWLPAPGPGLTLKMSSGRRFRYRLQLADPGALISAIGPALPSAASTLSHPSIAYARARHLLVRRRWYFWLVKYGVLPLALTVILFRLHQYIVFGGPFGQYRLFGLTAYLKSFLTFWAGTAGGLVVYAGLVRLLAEVVALALTAALPSRALIVRRSVEIFCQLVYFGLVPAYVVARLLL